MSLKYGTQRLVLPVVVFVTGACVLIVEIVATRILSPYFGNTIFTVSSVIGVILAALSAGYYFGGRTADRHPNERWFYGIIFIGGLSVFWLQLLSIFLLPVIGYSLSMVHGPLVASLALFFLPGFFLGMLSPFAVTLQKKYAPEEGIGSVAGGIFFWSTLGSIVGSLSAGFLLIPYFGIEAIIFGVGMVLLLLGALPTLWAGRGGKLFVLIVIVTSVSLLSLALERFVSRASGIIESRDGIYEKLSVQERAYKGKQTRFFWQDRIASSAMFLDSDELVFDYSKYYALQRIFSPNLTRALVIGAGAYSVPKALLAADAKVHVDVVEIEPALMELGKKYFRVPEDPRLHNYIEDGRRFLHDVKTRYDLVFSDVYFSHSVPAHFATQEFFQLARSKLNDDGVFVANLIGTLSPQPPSFIFSEMRTFQTVFPNSYFFAVESLGTTNRQNIIFIGYNSDKTINFKDSPSIRERANRIIAGLDTKVIDPRQFELSSYALLTDDYAPTEALTARTFLHEGEPH